MERRKFILSTITVAALFSMPAIVYKSWRRIAINPLITPDILARFCDEDTVRMIGLHYRSLVPEECKKEKLQILIMEGNVRVTDDDGIADLIGKRVRKDFEENKMIVVDGWILSETEARQCALYSLV